MKYGFGVVILSLVVGCGQSVNNTKPAGDPPVVPKEPAKLPPAVAASLAKKLAGGNDADVSEHRKTAESLEERAKQFDVIGNSYSRDMMFAAMAWQKAGEKDRALAAVQAAMKAGPGDRTPLDKSNWHVNIGDVLVYAGELPLAIEHYEAAVKVSPTPFSASLAQKKLDDAKTKLAK
jgi:tetratricopeptide (TPR) repeat protein